MRITLASICFIAACAPAVTHLPPALDPSNPRGPESRLNAPPGGASTASETVSDSDDSMGVDRTMDMGGK